jgi:hypothetical protein
MGQSAERSKKLAQNLVEILSSYEEELIALEREAPAVGQLRRAVGITIAEACYIVTDDAAGQVEWKPSSNGPTPRQ